MDAGKRRRPRHRPVAIVAGTRGCRSRLGRGLADATRDPRTATRSLSSPGTSSRSRSTRGADVEVVDRTYGGTAICDRLDQMRTRPARPPTDGRRARVRGQQRHRLHARARTARLRETPSRRQYRHDASIATSTLRGCRGPGVLDGRAAVSGPRASDSERVRRGVRGRVARLTFATPPLARVEYVDAGQAVLDHGRFTDTTAVPADRGAGRGCGDGRIRVRAARRGPRCVVGSPGDATRCRVYPAGALRCGYAMAGPGPAAASTGDFRGSPGITVTPPSDTAAGDATTTRRNARSAGTTPAAARTRARPAGRSRRAADAAPCNGPSGGSTTAPGRSDVRASPRPERRWNGRSGPTPHARCRRRVERA